MVCPEGQAVLLDTHKDTGCETTRGTRRGCALKPNLTERPEQEAADGSERAEGEGTEGGEPVRAAFVGGEPCEGTRVEGVPEELPACAELGREECGQREREGEGVLRERDEEEPEPERGERRGEQGRVPGSGRGVGEAQARGVDEPGALGAVGALLVDEVEAAARAERVARREGQEDLLLVLRVVEGGSPSGGLREGVDTRRTPRIATGERRTSSRSTPARSRRSRANRLGLSATLTTSVPRSRRRIEARASWPGTSSLHRALMGEADAWVLRSWDSTGARAALREGSGAWRVLRARRSSSLLAEGV